MASWKPKIYCAGQDIFLPDALAKSREQKHICQWYGFEALHPMDNNLDKGDQSYRVAVGIWQRDVTQIGASDVVAANCNPFRGALVDDGVAYELGAANMIGVASYGYVSKLMPYTDRVRMFYQCIKIAGTDIWVDKDGYLLMDDFETTVNLMLQCGMTESGGRLVEGNFEACIRAIRQDIDSGVLLLSR